jgi:muramoyltetrapeptide carboxypeptidase
MENIIYPAPLKAGDKIAICSPASIINPDFVAGAVAELTRQGWEPVVMPHALGRCGNYSGSIDERLADMVEALTNAEYRAVLCSRGGYGVVHLLDRLSQLNLREDPKWVIGFSDISAMHALMHSQGIASVHSSMAKAITQGDANPDNATLYAILRGSKPSYELPHHELNVPGNATGTLLGGNVAVLADLISTPFNMMKPDTVLFIEDIAEPIYKIERILYQLRLNGVLPSLRALIVGQFTEYKPDANFASMEQMIHNMVADYGYPVVFNAPIGHVDHNIPLVEGATVSLTGTHLQFQ